MSEIDEKISEWERRFEDILIEMMRYRRDGKFAVSFNPIPVATAVSLMMDDFRHNAGSPLRAGLKHRA